MHPSHLVAELRRWADLFGNRRIDAANHMPDDHRKRLVEVLDDAIDMIDGEFGPYHGIVYVDGEGAPEKEQPLHMHTPPGMRCNLVLTQGQCVREKGHSGGCVPPEESSPSVLWPEERAQWGHDHMGQVVVHTDDSAPPQYAKLPPEAEQRIHDIERAVYLTNWIEKCGGEGLYPEVEAELAQITERIGERGRR